MTNVIWPETFKQQYKLSAHIEEKHPRKEGEDRLAKKVLALQVEVGEMANEWRGFKFWSENQEPKTFASDSDPTAGLYREWNPLLDEYIDVVHFTAELGIEIKLEDYQIKKVSLPIDKLISNVMYLAHMVGEGFNLYDDLISCVDALGGALGFTPDEIKAAYEKKNQINFNRQASGY